MTGETARLREWMRTHTHSLTLSIALIPNNHPRVFNQSSTNSHTSPFPPLSIELRLHMLTGTHTHTNMWGVSCDRHTLTTRYVHMHTKTHADVLALASNSGIRGQKEWGARLYGLNNTHTHTQSQLSMHAWIVSDISNSLVSSCNPDCSPPSSHLLCCSVCLYVCVCLLLRSPQGALRCHFLFVDMHVVVATLWARSTVPLPSVPCMCVSVCVSLHGSPLSSLWVTGAGLVMELNSLCK